LQGGFLGRGPLRAEEYYRARYYDPKIGRFISEDPIRLRGGVNVYEYAHNNPTRFGDPLGLDEFELGLSGALSPPPIFYGGEINIALTLDTETWDVGWEWSWAIGPGFDGSIAAMAGWEWDPITVRGLQTSTDPSAQSVPR
jgi:uncharacterized protein RhaS with RHS repeats